MHFLASKSVFGRGDGEVASLESGVGVMRGVFIEFGANLEDSCQCKQRTLLRGGGRLARCRRLCLECGGDLAMLLRLVL